MNSKVRLRFATRAASMSTEAPWASISQNNCGPGCSSVVAETTKKKTPTAGTQPSEGCTIHPTLLAAHRCCCQFSPLPYCSTLASTDGSALRLIPTH